jgi:hypothetical protein
MPVRHLPILIALAACSSPPTRSETPQAPRRTPPVAAIPGAPMAEPPSQVSVVAAEPLPEWKAHRCKKSVWPAYESYSDEDPSEQVSTYEEPDPGGGGDAGRTLDEKTRELDKTRPRTGVCDVRIREELETAILRAPAPRPATTFKAWDRKAALGFRDLVRSKLALGTDEEAQLVRDGFVVPARLQYADYTSAYSDLHRSELPVYVSADSILHAVYASHDQLVASLEKRKLLEHLDATLGALHCGLVSAASSYPDDVANDLDLYLTVARTLLATDTRDSCCDEVPSELGKVDAAAQKIVRTILAAGPMTELEMFGRPRALDASQYAPRGHYAGDPDLEAYFRAAMWLSRTEFNLVSRDSRSSQPGYDPDPRETPREAMVALALADLVKRTRAARDIAAIDQAWSAFAGKREDVPFAELEKLRAKAGITNFKDPDAPARLRTAIGEGFKRTVNVHPMPNVEHLPVIATMIGPRITPDTVALGGLIADRGPSLQAAEVGYMLGHDRGLAYVTATPALTKRLHDARDHMEHAPVGGDLYSAWLAAIRALAVKPEGTTPSFMATEPFADLRLDSALAAYGQLRHNHVLIAAQVYDQSGCDIPDGYVEPALATYQALAEYAARGKTVFASLDPQDKTHGKAYFAKLERLLKVLVALSREELANRPLSDTAKRFLADIVEMRESSAWDYSSTFPIATYDGWYLDLFPFQDVAFKEAAFIADYATFDVNGKRGIHYLGAKGPRLGVFVVDTGGAPRLMVGPVARAYQHTGPLDHRLDDAASATIEGSAPWAKSYTAEPPTAPDLSLEFVRPPPPSSPNGPMGPRRPATTLAPNTLHVDSATALGEITVDLLDHHFATMRSIKVTVAKGITDATMPALPRPIESIQIHVGRFVGRMDLDLVGRGWRGWGTKSPPPPPPPHRRMP